MMSVSLLKHSSKASNCLAPALRLLSTGSHTHFGFQNVATADKQSLVGGVFGSVASSYDLMNDVMSFGVHRLWKDAFVHALRPTSQMRILDCAGGTGDIAFRIAESRRKTGLKGPPVTVCDINPKMLEVGVRRARKNGIGMGDVDFVEGNAEKLPMPDESFDVYVISFGMRNIPRPEVALTEALRVLKPGGRFMMLEFARVSDPVLANVYDSYSFHAIPAFGGLFANDRQAYQYLIESIRRFPGQNEFQDMMRVAGLVNVTCQDYTFGVCAQYSGFKGIQNS